ncbi:hypothetical protein ACLOJK_003143 [Asimina triloba]
MGVGSCMGFLSHKWEFGSGSWIFEGFTGVYNISMLFLVLVLGLKFLKLGMHYKGIHRFFGMSQLKLIELRRRFCCGKESTIVLGPKVLSFDGGFSNFKKILTTLSGSLEGNEDEFFETTCDFSFCPEGNVELADCKVENFNGFHKVRESFEEDQETADREDFSSCDGEYDIVQIKNVLQIERERRIAAYLELEKERLAAASSANEAMVMIQRLQNEKNLIESEARLYRSMAEQKQLYDREVIRALQWIISRHELEKIAVGKGWKQIHQGLSEENSCSENNKEEEEGSDDRSQAKDWEINTSEGDDCTLEQSFIPEDDYTDQFSSLNID